MEQIITRFLGPDPAARQRLGADIFIAIPLYRSLRPATPIYINTAAYMRIFKPAAPPAWEEMAATLTTLFSTTIEPEHGTGEVVATAYADRQSDPLDLSLSGNLGSGRAYYAGACFNIKGERTPLATASKKQFSDGFLEMERALWETLVAGGLQGAIGNGLNDVLAILDMNDTCTVGWRDGPVTRAKIIRIDDGCLDRVTHLFHAPRPLPAAALHDIAAAYGRLEADKFAGRVVHGTWSPGNISLQGHLIDFDTVATVKGRGPLYSSTKWYHHNRFGFEHGGQAAILSALAGHTVINRDGVSAHDLHASLHDRMRQHLLFNFIRLMGFDDAPAVAAQHHDILAPLCDLWQELSRKAYDCPEALMVKDTRAHHVHVFDLSLLMALYPLYARRGPVSAASLLALAGGAVPERAPPPALSATEQEHMDAVMAVIGPHIVTTDEQHDMLQLAALGFVKKYDKAMRAILAAGTHDPLQVEAAALARNADCTVLFPALTPTFRIAQNTQGRSAFHRHAIITSLIAAARRPLHQPPASGSGHTLPLGIYDEGALAVLLDGQGGYRLAFTPHDTRPLPAAIGVLGNMYTIDNKGISDRHDLVALLDGWTRESSLHPPEACIYSQIEHIEDGTFLTPL